MTAGAVLCGGASRRMGVDKALLEVGGVAMAERVAVALAGAGCEPVVFVGGDAARLAAFGRPTVADQWPGQGPAGGVLTALAALDDDVVVAACDLPLLRAGTVRRLVAVGAVTEVDVVVATTDRFHPTLAWWRHRSVPAIEQRWQQGARALHDIIGGLRRATVDVDPADVRNVNTLAERSEAEVRAGYIGEMAVSEIDVDQLADRLREGANLIDVREPDEYTAGHVPGAVSIPLGTVPDHLDEFRGAGPTYVICNSGGRSRRACKFVDAQGLEGVATVNVEGGTSAWIASGRATVGGDRPS